MGRFQRSAHTLLGRDKRGIDLESSCFGVRIDDACYLHGLHKGEWTYRKGEGNPVCGNSEV